MVGSFLFKVPVDRVGEPITSQTALVAEWSLSAQEALADAPDATPDELAASIDDWLPGGSEPYIQAFFPMSLTVFLPVIGTGAGLPGRVEAVARPRSSTARCTSRCSAPSSPRSC